MTNPGLVVWIWWYTLGDSPRVLGLGKAMNGSAGSACRTDI